MLVFQCSFVLAFVSKIVTLDKYFQKMYVVTEQSSIISDWVWVTKGSLQFNKHSVIALVIMTKLISDQLPSLLTREEEAYIERHSGESMRGTPEEQMKATPLLLPSVSCHSACGWWWLGREALATVLCPRRSAFGARCAPSPAPGYCNRPERAQVGVSPLIIESSGG